MTVIKVKYDEKYLKRTFKDWDLVELKSCLKELEDKRKNSFISREELSWIQPIREEIERRNKYEKNILCSRK